MRIIAALPVTRLEERLFFSAYRFSLRVVPRWKIEHGLVLCAAIAQQRCRQCELSEQAGVALEVHDLCREILLGS